MLVSNETMQQAITVKLLPGEMHFNVATLRPFLQHLQDRTKEKEAMERCSSKIKQRERDKRERE